jgi:hypothetical protein
MKLPVEKGVALKRMWPLLLDRLTGTPIGDKHKRYSNRLGPRDSH